MEFGNQSVLNELILIGFSQNLQTCVLLFILFLVVYTLIILGNSFLVCAVITSPQLHTPMYYFLCNLSFIDVWYSSNCLPKVLIDLFSTRRSISIIGCLIQMNTALFLGTTECIILAVMAYDRYIAICFPLHYTIYMNWKMCNLFTVITWSGSFLLTTVPYCISKPPVFCKEDHLDHFGCEILALLELACGDVSIHKISVFVQSLLAIFPPLVFIMVSYVCIITSILKIHSKGGRSKAFSTCASHLTVVCMLYGTCIITHVGRTKRFSSSLKYFSLIYGVLTPALNPFIYSVRNHEVKEAYKTILTKNSASWTGKHKQPQRM